MKIDGRFWLSKDGENFLGNGRVALLQNIAKTGSISGAAKAMKMSYKAAWERINQMNKLSDKPIITKAIGGKGGGGSVLTPHAYELIETFQSFEKLHRQFIDRFSEAGDDPERLARILGRTFLTTSARNQFACKINSIVAHGINGLLELEIESKDRLLTDITMKSIESMGLVSGVDAYAIIKSSDVLITTVFVEKSSVNIFKGKILEMESLGEDTEISFKSEKGALITSVMPLEKCKKLKINSSAFASISKRNIIIGL